MGSFFIPFVQLVAPYFAVVRGWKADVSPRAGPVAAWFWPWSASTALGYVSTVVVVTDVFSAAFNHPGDRAAIEAARPAWIPWLGLVTVLLQAVSAFFLIRIARQWAAARSPGAVSPAA